jgi:hypothetical protein
MATGNSAALKVRQPQSVAVRLPHPLRTVTNATYSNIPNVSSNPRADRSPAEAADDQMTPRAYLVFALKVVASAFVGAAATILLWSAVQRPAIDPAQLDQAVSRDEATIQRIVRDQPVRPERVVRSWDAETTYFGQAVPKDFIRDIKTVKFIAPAPQEIVAALSPVTQGNRSPVAVPVDKPQIKSWRYQLQGINPYVVAKSSADLVVIDLFRDDGAFTRAQVEQMQRKPDGSRRIVLSYMSIGEAEDYRWYWPHRSSAWLGPENSKWRGNYGGAVLARRLAADHLRVHRQDRGGRLRRRLSRQGR